MGWEKRKVATQLEKEKATQREKRFWRCTRQANTARRSLFNSNRLQRMPHALYLHSPRPCRNHIAFPSPLSALQDILKRKSR